MSHLNQKRAYIRLVFGVVICIMFTAAAAALLFLPVPEANSSAVNILIGSLSTLIGMVFTFYFGSSDESSKKSDTIDRVLAQTQSAVNETLPPYDGYDDLEEVEGHYGVVDSHMPPSGSKTRPSKQYSPHKPINNEVE